MATRGWQDYDPRIHKKVKALANAFTTGAPKPSKYRSQKVTDDGLTFDSKREYARYIELRLLLSVGAIKDLMLQPAFDLYAANGERVAVYYADFSYFDLAANATVVEDVKSKATMTAVYKLKKKLMQAQGIPIRELL